MEKVRVDCLESELKKKSVEPVERYEDVGDYDAVLRWHCRLEEE